MSETTPKQAEKPLLWADMNRQELAAAMERKSLVLIPTGSTEQHADHLPVGTDTSLADAFAKRAAARMTAPVVVAPAVPFGFAPHHLSLTGTISLRLETYLAMLSDMARSIIDSGFSRAIFINGHGGNDVPARQATFELRQKLRSRSDLLLLSATYWSLTDPRHTVPDICQPTGV